MFGASARCESNPPVFGKERDLVKARAAVDHLRQAQASAHTGLRLTRQKRERLIAQLDGQVAEAEVSAARADEELEAARLRLVNLKET